MNKTSEVHSGHRDRLKQRFISGGFSGMQPHEVLELLLYFIVPRRDTNALAHALIEKYGSLGAVLTAPAEALAEEPYITKNGAVLLNMFGYSGDCSFVLDGDKTTLNTPNLVVRFAKRILLGKTKEEFLVLCLDGRDRLVRFFSSQGTVNSVSAYNREIVQKLLNANATSVILAHNHPSGDTLPSPDDVDATRGIKTVLDALGINLYDHIIIAGDNFYSFVANGLFESDGTILSPGAKHKSIFAESAETKYRSE